MRTIAPLSPSLRKPLPRGFTLVELMAVLAVVAVIVTLAAPSFTRMIEMQRLRGVQAQLVTDMQFARSEAVSRNSVLRIDFRNTPQLSCYTMYTAPFVQGEDGPCDCTLGPGNACTGIARRTEVRTVQVPASTGVTVRPLEPPDQFFTSFGFDPTTGGLVSNPNDDGPTAIDDFRIDVFLDADRKLRTWIERSGRPMVCRPATSRMPEAACPVFAP
jgi:type IV fimbrial biogenesis protein FimT